MGFWKKAFEVSKQIGSAVVTQAQEKANEIQELQYKYANKSDSELLKIVHSDGFTANSGTEKLVAKKILRDRGMTDEQIHTQRN